MVFCEGLHEDQDVVHVAYDHPLADKTMENVIHHSLESGWGVTKAEEHHPRFVQPVVGGKGGLPLVPLLDPDVVETPLKVQSSEPLGSSEP